MISVMSHLPHLTEYLEPTHTKFNSLCFWNRLTLLLNWIHKCFESAIFKVYFPDKLFILSPKL